MRGEEVPLPSFLAHDSPISITHIAVVAGGGGCFPRCCSTLREGSVAMPSRCEGCPYRGLAVGAIGNPHAEVMLIGEAPGTQELARGRPFIGPSGQLLWETMRRLGIPNAEH